MAAKFDEALIGGLAKTTGFVQRKSKLKPMDFLKTLMFIYHRGKDLSLSDLCGDLSHNCGLDIRKQSIQARFNEKAVAFLKAVLSNLLKVEIPAIESSHPFTSFDRIRIKDSTRFALPDAYANVYEGHGGATHNSKSMISIQYEYDLLSAETLDLRLTSGTQNDQADAKKHTHDIRKNDLFIRDLGYATIGYLLQIIKKGAFFLNRIAPQTTVYYADEPEKQLDFKACYHRMKKQKLSFLEFDVLIGKKKEIRSRLVIHLADEATYKMRLHKTSKHAKSCGYKVSDAFKVKARLTLYITNADEENIPASTLSKVYGLRWQIELIFKVWKSQAVLHRIKEMKIHRFQCQLLGRLIWLMLHWNFFKHVAHWLNTTTSLKTASAWKYYKYAHAINQSVRETISTPNKLKELLAMLTDRAIPHFVLEKRKNKQTHYEVLNMLN
jgi:hypothetical protein